MESTGAPVVEHVLELKVGLLRKCEVERCSAAWFGI